MEKKIFVGAFAKCKCGHNLNDHSYSDEKIGCDKCKCHISLGDDYGNALARIARLEAALKPFAECDGTKDFGGITGANIQRAAEALREKP